MELEPAVYLGSGDGSESGPFNARIAVSRLPGGSLAIDYRAASAAQDVLHEEHTVLSAGVDGRRRLYVAHSESATVTEFVERADEVGAFDAVAAPPARPTPMTIRIGQPEPGRITYAWWWSPDSNPPVEQSCADVRRADGD